MDRWWKKDKENGESRSWHLLLPSRPEGHGWVHEHNADLPSSEYSSWQGENWQNNKQGYVALPDSSRVYSTAAQHGEAGVKGTSAEMGQRTWESPVLCCYSQCKLAIWHTGSQASHRTKTLPGLLPALTDNLWTLWQMHKQQLGRVKTCKSVFSMSCLGWDVSPEGQGPKISWAHLKWSLKGCHGTCDSKSCNHCWPFVE